MIDLIEVYEHWWAGRSQVQIAASLGIDRQTVRKYLEPARAAGIVPGGPPVMTRADWPALVGQWFPQVADAVLRNASWPAIAAHRDYILEQLGQGVTQATIHQRLVDELHVDTSYSSLRRWVAGNLPEEVRRGRVRGLRTPVAPGDEAQIDYGRLGSWVQPVGGRRVTIWAFVMVLSCSRYMFVRPVIRMDQQAWTAATVAAFEFFGGVPARLVPDNLKTGVDRPDLYDPKINRSYGELAGHYGTLVDPARSFKPKDKPHVERAMPYVRDSYWRGREFTSLEGMQDDAVRWCLQVAGRRHHRGLDGAEPAAVFAALEAPALRALPRTAFTLATWSSGKVGPDVHVKVGSALYSVPWRLIGERVEARSTALMVQIMHDGQVVASHPRSERARRTTMSHYPPEKIAFHQRTPTWCRTTAIQVGPACTDVIGGLLAEHALYRLRSAQGILGLRDKYTPERLENACAAALSAGDPSYRTIKGILAAGLDTAHTTTGGPSGGSAAVPAFLRGQDSLFAVPDPVCGPEAAAVHPASTSPAASSSPCPVTTEALSPARPTVVAS